MASQQPPALGPPLIITTDIDQAPAPAAAPTRQLEQGGAAGPGPGPGPTTESPLSPVLPTATNGTTTTNGTNLAPPSPTLTTTTTSNTNTAYENDTLYTPISTASSGQPLTAVGGSAGGLTSVALRDNQPMRDGAGGAGGGGGGGRRRSGSGVTWEDDGRVGSGGGVDGELTPIEENGGRDKEVQREKEGLPLPVGSTASASGGNTTGSPRKTSLWAKVRRLLLFRSKTGEDDGITSSPSSTSNDAAGAELSDDEKARLAAHASLDPSLDTADPTPFAFKPLELAGLLDPKNLDELEKLGGLDGLMEGLGADPVRGLDENGCGNPDEDGSQYRATWEDRRRVYGENLLPKKKSKSFLQLCWMAFQDKMLILLSVAAVVSLALGIYQSVGGEPEYQHAPGCPPIGCEIPRVDWIEGVAIAVAIVVIVLVSSLSDWRKEKQFQLLNEQREDRMVTAVRGGKQVNINTKDVVVGDVLVLAPGEVLPCDGIFLRGSDCKADEAAATGESDLIKKASYDECIIERDSLKEGQHAKRDCFMISGSKIADGVGEYLVVAVGRKSFNGRLMMSLQGEAEATPLQVKLNRLADRIAQFGGGAGALLFTALMIKFFVQLKTNPDRSADAKGQDFIQILIISVTLVVVSVPEGLPLAVVLALSFATRKMMSQNLLVRVLASCETMGNATVIATDKTGTLTKADMQVVAGSLGVHGKFVQRLQENVGRSNANKVIGEDGEPIRDQQRMDFSIDAAQLNDVVPEQLMHLISESIAINSTAFEEVNPETGEVNYVGSKTETALLKFAKSLDWPDSGKVRAAADVVRMIPFSSEQKCMACVVRLPDGRQRLMLKGASEILTKLCTNHVKVSPPEDTRKDSEVETEPFTEDTSDNINRSIIFYANQSLRTIALCYKEYPADADLSEVELADLARDLSLIMIVGIEDPLREGVIEAVANCQKASIRVVMVTGDNVLTARSIARQCGILTPGGLIMEGPTFRTLTHQERIDLIPYLQILARSSPEDKRLLVETFKELGETVAASGDGANDAAALKLANVGFSMGIAGTEVAKTASDIIIMDDSFASMVTACMWGRAVNDAVRKFLQFQLSVNVSAILITFISAVSSSDESSVLTAVQLLWINLVMDTLAALALASAPPNRKILDRKPDRKSAPLLSSDMLKMILGQAIFQAIVCLVLHFVGLDILNEEHTDANEAELSSLVFNVFVFCQIFNIINCRRVDRKFNIFEDIHRNLWFIGIFMIILGGQVLIAFVGGQAFSIVRINGRDWAISIIIGLMSIPLGFLIRLSPTAPFERFLIKCRLYPDPNKLPTISAEAEERDEYEYNEALTKVRDNLHTFARIRGGRIGSSPLVVSARRRKLKKANIHHSSILTMVPTLVAGTVGAGSGWANKVGESSGLENPAGFDPSRSSANLWRGKLTFYEPDVNSEVYMKYGPKQ